MYYAESVNNEYAFPASFCPSYDAYERGFCNESRTDSDMPVAYMGYVADGRSVEERTNFRKTIKIWR